jgi:hypothetical protein
VANHTNDSIAAAIGSQPVPLTQFAKIARIRISGGCGFSLAVGWPRHLQH